MFSSGVQTYTFSKETTHPTLRVFQNDHEITVEFSELVLFGNDSPGSVVGYLSRKKQPTSMADVVHTYTVEDADINGNTITFKTDISPDGDYYFLPFSIKDGTDNYYQLNWTDSQLLTFEDSAAAANRVKIDLSKDNSFIIPANISWRDRYENTGRHDGTSISFSWKLDGKGSSTIGSSYYPFQDHSTYLYSFNQSATQFRSPLMISSPMVCINCLLSLLITAVVVTIVMTGMTLPKKLTNYLKAGTFRRVAWT